LIRENIWLKKWSFKLKVFIKTLIVLLIISFSVIASLIFWFNRQTGNIPVSGVEFEIKNGDNGYTISKRLYNSGFIRNDLLFVAFIRIFGLDNKIKKGWILLEADSSTTKIIKSIINGKFITQTFTIPEGANLAQIKEILIKNQIVSEDELNDFFKQPNFLSKIGLNGYQSAEGFIFPETYKVYKGSDVSDVFSEMTSLFFKKMAIIYPDYKNLPKKEFYNRVILASIIEREVKNKDEASIVAGIFLNRINIKMKLQSCATVQYILPKPKEHLLESDLLIDNPYNTYLYNGLPPTPIASPGANALKAAFFPDKNEFLFFVVKDPVKGTHHFSKTYDEHLIAQKRYKQIKGLY